MGWEQDTFKTKYRLIAKAREIFRWHPMRKEAKKRAQISPYIYRCETCGCLICDRDTGFTEDEYNVFVEEEGLLLFNEKLEIDHIYPIGKVVDWNDFYNDLFCGIERLQCICKSCHYLKTCVEREEGLWKK